MLNSRSDSFNVNNYWNNCSLLPVNHTNNKNIVNNMNYKDKSQFYQCEPLNSEKVNYTVKIILV